MTANLSDAKDSATSLLRDYGGAILIAVLVALAIRTFVIEAYRIPSASMKPALEAGDTIFVAKWPYGLRLPKSEKKLTDGRLPEHGEIVVFSRPEEPGKDYIKRVIALPGDTIEMRKGHVILNGKDLTLKAEKNSVCGEETLSGQNYDVCWEPPVVDDLAPQKIKDGTVLLVSDLRTKPSDPTASQTWALVPADMIKAKAMWIWLSIDPPSQGRGANWFSRIRFERMFRRVQ